MKTTIFYFTGTGNCLKVARDLAREFGDTNIVSIANVINQEINLSSECIGLVYPVYMFGMPLIVAKFIKKLEPAKDKYIFAVATCGGMAADTLGQNERLLKAQGLKLSAGFVIKMPGNYAPLYGALKKEKQKKLFEKEGIRIKEIAKIVKEKKESKIEKGGFLANAFFSGVLYNSMSHKIPFCDRPFWVDEKCIHCGICVKVCPAKNIMLIENKPVWLHKCEQCFACLQWCPKEAIQYGKNTSVRKRYRNPEIKLEDLMLD